MRSAPPASTARHWSREERQDSLLFRADEASDVSFFDKIPSASPVQVVADTLTYGWPVPRAHVLRDAVTAYRATLKIRDRL
jgi:hypothetical protein